jgi:hypothetical protein
MASIAESPSRSRSLSLWLWVAAGFLFLACLWTAMFVVARSAHIESIPRVGEVRR